MTEPNLKAEVTQLHANLCSAISDPRRILLLYAIHDQPRNVSRLAEIVEISQPAASRHLNLLRERGLVEPHREGSSVIYTLTDPRLITALDLLRDVLFKRLEDRAGLLPDQPEN